ncbi:MAG: TIGR04283 family arsenosugar biosynthesis glycosyltransferase [Cyanobacteriota bacterium]|nr:TIGR04283 family arsenosugar biosynthesis glycosyltransferase [Cyanobacteriota bacterium]
MTKISVIIPVLNEASAIARTIASARVAADLEIIVVDGGSRDGTVETAESLGVRVLQSPPGRAMQMNSGAREAGGEILLFLHGDTILPPEFDKSIRLALAKAKVVAGAFELKIEGTMGGLSIVEKMVNWRSRYLQMPYGDQAIFLTSKIFWQIGGFPEMPIMEDFELIRRLQRRGKIETLPMPVVTSPRRWQKLGVLRTTLINQLVIIAYFLGISPERLARWYRGQKNNS